MRQILREVLAVGVYSSLFLATAEIVRCQDPVLIAHNAATSTNTGTVSTAALNTTGANTLLACYGASTAGNVVSPISDTIGGVASGNTWVLIRHLPYASDTQASIWASFAANVGANHVFTATGYAPALAVGAFSGISSGPDTGAAPPSGVISSEGSPSPATLGTLSPTNANELIWNCLTGHFGSGQSPASSSPLTTLDSVPSTGESVYAIMSGYEIQTTATPTSVVDTWTGSLSYVIGLATPFFSVANPAPLTIPSFTLPEAFKTSPYSYQLVAQGGNRAYTWTQTGGIAISTYGLILSPSGLISGTPTSAVSGTSVTFTVTDSSSPTPLTNSTSGITLTIASAPLAISTTTCPSGTQYMSYTGCTISAAGGTGSLTITYPTTGGYGVNYIPEGLSMDSSTGIITGSQIGGQGIYQVTFTVTDSLGATAKSSVINFSIQGDNSWIAPDCPSSPTIFPCNNIIYSRVDAASTSLPVDTSPAAPISSSYAGIRLTMVFGAYINDGGFGANRVADSQTLVGVNTTAYNYYFGTGSNGAVPVGTPAPTAPIPLNAAVEGAIYQGDAHVLVWKESGSGHNPFLFEMFNSQPISGAWQDASNALFDSTSNVILTQGTTAASHTPILPFLYNADEIIGTGTPTSPNGIITHAGILVGPGSSSSPGTGHFLGYYTWPAGGCDGCTSDSIFVGSCYNGATLIPRGTFLSESSPPTSCTFSGIYGERYRISASYSPPACLSTSPQATIIFTAWKNYGLILTDLGDFFSVEGFADPRLNDTDIQCLNNVAVGALEPVNVSSLMVVGPTSMQAGGSGGTAPTSFTSGCPTSTATQGVPYSFTMVANGTTPLTYGIAYGALPSGLSINGGTGVISGTPLGSGTQVFSPSATNAAGGINQSCSITVTPVSPGVPFGISAAGAIAKAFHRWVAGTSMLFHLSN